MLRYFKYLIYIVFFILLVRYFRYVNNFISIFDFDYYLWLLLELFKKCIYVFYFDFVEGFKLYE